MPCRDMIRKPKTALVCLGVAVAITGGLSLAQAASASISADPGSLVTIDASNPANKADAETALALYAQPGATDRSFDPTSDPTYNETGWTNALDPTGAELASVTGDEANGTETSESLEASHTETSSVTVGGSVEVSVGAEVADIVDVELSAKFTASHTWEAESNSSQEIDVTADPGKTVWIQTSTNLGTITGNISFTINDVHYQVNNVTITQPVSDLVQGAAVTNYRVMEIDNSKLGLPKDTPGGKNLVKNTPQVKAATAAAAAAIPNS